MNINKLNDFKNRQNCLAQKLSKTLKGIKYTITYEEYIPSAYVDKHTGLICIETPCQQYIPNSKIKISEKKQRINVVINFERKLKKFEKRKIEKVIKRGHIIIDNKVIYSINPNLLFSSKKHG